MTTPAIGTKAPSPAGITDQNGKAVDLTSFKGQHVLLYFYPKDDTPGCTVEACNFRDHKPDLKAVIFGVSLDDAASHKAFIAKHKLSFDLIVDRDHKLAAAYGVLPEGAKTTQRSSFLIGPDGLIKHVWPKVKPDGHWQEVKEAIG